MKRLTNSTIKFLNFALFLFLVASPLHADENVQYFPPVSWTSTDTKDVVTIENGTSATLVIVITVGKSDVQNPPGIAIRNCGATQRIAPGSTGVCMTRNRDFSVNFNSESQTEAVSGTYQIKQQR